MRLCCVLLSLGLAGCARDLELPTAPTVGLIRGAVDTAPYLLPGDHEVVLESREGAQTRARTDADGGFVFAPVQPGDYLVSTQPSGFALLQRAFVRVRNGEEVDLGVLQPAWRGAAIEVSGKVAIQGSGDPNGAQVEFLLLPQRRRVALSAVGLSGDFVERVPPGDYELQVSHPLYVTFTSPTIELRESRPTVALDPFVLQIDPATLTGHVVMERDGEAPVPAPNVSVTVEPQGLTTVTDSSGDFSLTGLSAGVRRVRFSRVDFHDPSPLHELELSPGVTSTLPEVFLALDRGDVVGTVVLADRQPATGVSVGIAAARKATTVVPDASDPSRGTFTLAGVPVGSWEVAVTKQGYARATQGGVQVAKDRAVSLSPITLTTLQGDFVIDDGDSSNTSGYTRTPQVTLQLTGFTSAAGFRISEDPNFPDAGFAPFTGTTQPFALRSNEGSHVVYAQYRDVAGVESPVFVSSIVLDATPPSMAVVRINDGVDFSARAQPLSLRLEATDVAAAVVDQTSGIREVRLSESAAVDGSGRLVASPRAWLRDDSFTRSTAADGPVRVHAQFFDHAGNASAVVFDDVVIDTAPPVGSLTIRDGQKASAAGYTNTERVQLDVTFTPEPSAGYLRLKLAPTQAGLATAAAVPIAATLLHELDPVGADGARQVWYVLLDGAGNQSAPASQGIVLDRTPPVISAFSLGVTSPTRLATFPLSWVVNDGLGLSATEGFSASEDAFFQSPGTVGPVAVPASSTYAFTPSSGDGSRVVYARFRDRAGNEAFASARTEVDRTAPTGAFLLEGRLGDNSPSATHTSVPGITALVLHQGALEVAVGDEAMMTCPSTGYVALPADGRLPVTLSGVQGVRTVKMCLRDLAGNVSALLTGNIRFETAAPSGCTVTTQGYRADVGNAPAGRTAKPIITVGLSGCAAASPVKEWVVSETALTCTLPGLAWEAFGAGAFALAGGDGVHTLYACVRNEARNVATLTPVTIDLDSTPPLGPSLVLDGNAPWVNLAAYTARGSRFEASALGAVTGATEWSLSESTTFTDWRVLATSNPRTWLFPGTGARRLYAAFRDDLGNTTVPVSDDLTFDIVAPSVSGLSLALSTSSPDPAFVATGNFAVNVVSAPPADAANALLAQVAPTTACTGASVFSGVLPRNVERVIPVVAAGGDGAKRLCVAWLDAAGNPSAPLTLNLTVDTTPPTPPELQTGATLVNLADDSTFAVTLVRPIIETNFLRTERTGGKDLGWVDTGAAASATSFDFRLISSAGQERVVNTLQLRAVDRAGNVGPASEVRISTDIKPPQAPTLSTLGVSNLSGAGSVFWAAPFDTDLLEYLLDYGPASGQYNGTFASEGSSPVRISKDATESTLHSLTNGSPVYVQLRARDLAGNESYPSSEVVLQPNRMSPTLIAETQLNLTNELTDLEIDGDVAYALGTDLRCTVFGPPPNSPTEAVLSAIDLSGLKSATQSGRLELSSPPPVLWSLRFAEPQGSTECMQIANDFVVDGPWGFLATNERVRILRMGRRATAPTVVTTLTFPWKVRTLTVQGTTLLVNGAAGVMAVDLGPLYDDSAATRPALPANTIGTLAGYVEAGQRATNALTVSRNRLVQFAMYQGTGAQYWNVADGLDDNAATPFDNGDFVGSVDGASYFWLTRAPTVSGNLTFSFNDGKIQSRELSALWTGTPATLPARAQLNLSSSFSMGGPLEISGPGGWGVENDGDALYSADLRLASSGTTSLGGRLQLDPTQRVRSLKQWGPYLLAGTARGKVQFLELSTPRAMRVVASAPVGSPKYVFEGPLAYGSAGSVLDLQAGLAPTELADPAQVYSSSNPDDFVDAVVMDEQIISAYGGDGRLRVWDARKSNDRSAATTASIVPFTDGYEVVLPGVLRVLALESWGAALVAVEHRADGLWLEVFDARALRDGNPATSLAPSASRAAVRFSTAVSAGPEVDLALSHGRAFITVKTWDLVGIQPLYAYDFRGLFDDDGTTTGLVAQGTLPVENGSAVAVSGNRAYVANAPQLRAWDVGPAMDDSAATVLSAATPLAAKDLDDPREVVAYGTRVFAVNMGSNFAGRTWALDFSDPLAPRISALALLGCQGVGVSGVNGQSMLPCSLNVSGEFLYVSGSIDQFARTSVLELE